ncbi:MAG: hypothetical protein K2O37_01995 [Bacteroidales bacterium]|nr:hypothetical protein [Bacteroidales bacterium]
MYFCELKLTLVGMLGSPNEISLLLLQQPQTVFKVADIAMITGITDVVAISKRMAYAIRKGLFVSPRKGIYAKPGYSITELAGRLYTPSYLSLEYVLQQEGVIFQYSSEITMASYLNRTVEVDGNMLVYRKLKGDILANMLGVRGGILSVATKERAFLDMLYLNANCHFDNPSILDKEAVKRLLPVYNSPTLTKRALKIIEK